MADKRTLSGTRQVAQGWRVMNEEAVRRIKDRIERCRRLASFTNDAHTRKVLIDFAEEGEADLRRLGVLNNQSAPDMPNPQH